MRCSAKTKRGEQCRARASANGLCAMHAEPSRASAMGRKSGVARRCVWEESACLITIPETAAQIKTVLGQVILDLSNRRLAPKAACALGLIQQASSSKGRLRDGVRDRSYPASDRSLRLGRADCKT
jgi:hypothetical protein